MYAWLLALYTIITPSVCLQLRGIASNRISIFEPTRSVTLVSMMQKAERQVSDDSVDWWLWVVIAGLISIAILVTIAFRKPHDDVFNQEKRLVLNTKLISCQQIVTRSNPQIDPTLLGITIKGKSPNGELIEVFHQVGAHETEGYSTKFNWEDPEMSWIVPQPLSPSGPYHELVISIEQMSSSGGLVAIVASGIVTLKPPIVGSVFSSRFSSQMAELVSTSTGASVWGSLEFSIQYEPLENQLSVAQKQISKKLRILKPLFLASHSMAVVLVILDSFFGIRFLFSGCFASSIQSIISAGVISLLSIPMAAEWGQMHYNLPQWIVKIGKLNSQFKASVLLVCAIPQQILADMTGSSNCKTLFSVVGGLTFLDFLLFSILFVQQEANGQIAALFHFNCFKRPIPPSTSKSVESSRATRPEPVMSTKPPSMVVAGTPTQPMISPGSYAARRAARRAASGASSEQST